MHKNQKAKNKVKVYYWKGELGSEVGSDTSVPYANMGVPSFGHIAMEVKQRDKSSDKKKYISFWPGKCATWNRHNTFFCQENKPHFHSKKMDRRVSRPPHSKTVLRGLDTDAMIKACDAFETQNYNWNIFGSSILAINNETKNCAGLVYMLLAEGGIKNKVGFFSKNSDELENIAYGTAFAAEGGVAGAVGVAELISCISISGSGHVITGVAVVGFSPVFMVALIGGPLLLLGGAIYASYNAGEIARKLTVITPNDVAKLAEIAAQKSESSESQDSENAEKKPRPK
jgi:hypothetical protein